MQVCDKVNVMYDSRHIHDVYLKLFNVVAKKYDCRFDHNKEEGCINFQGDKNLLPHVRKEIIDTFVLIFDHNIV